MSEVEWSDVSGNYFYLHKWCILTKGVIRSALIDFDRHRIELIPNELCDLLLDHNSQKICDVLKAYGAKQKDILVEYFMFLITNEFVFLSNVKQNELLKNLELDFEFPQPINNAIVDWDKDSNYSMEKVITNLSTLGCQALHLRFFSAISFDKIEEYLQLLKNTTLRDVTLFVKYTDPGFDKKLKDLICDQYVRISGIVFHHYPTTKEIEFINKKLIIYSLEPGC